jgi:hypothetical protein
MNKQATTAKRIPVGSAETGRQGPPVQGTPASAPQPTNTQPRAGAKPRTASAKRNDAVPNKRAKTETGATDSAEAVRESSSLEGAPAPAATPPPPEPLTPEQLAESLRLPLPAATFLQEMHPELVRALLGAQALGQDEPQLDFDGLPEHTRRLFVHRIFAHRPKMLGALTDPQCLAWRAQIEERFGPTRLHFALADVLEALQTAAQAREHEQHAQIGAQPPAAAPLEPQMRRSA